MASASLLRLSSRLSNALSRSSGHRVPVTPGSGILRPFLAAPAFSARCSSSSTSSTDTPGSSRTNFGICIFNSSDEVFALSKFDHPGVWQMPQGVLYDEEDESAAVVEKLKEETGVPTRLLRFERGAYLQVEYEVTQAEKGIVMLRFCQDRKDQMHTWWFLRFFGEDKEINFVGDGKGKHQFAKWAWMSPEELVERALYPNKRLYLQAFENYFSGTYMSMLCIPGRNKKHKGK